MKKINIHLGYIPGLLIIWFPVLFGCSKAHTQVIIASGSTVSTLGNIQVVIADLDLKNAGSIVAPASTFYFTGNANNSIIGNGSSITFKNVTINKTSGRQLMLNRAINVNGILNFISGNIELNKQVLNLNSTGVLTGESEYSRITGINGGAVKANAILNAPNAVNIGNLGAVITSTANPGLVTITRQHVSAHITGGGDKSINRSFSIAAAMNTSLNCTLRFNYFDAELNGINESMLTQFQTPDGVNYTNRNYTTRNAAANYVAKAGYGSLSTFTLSRFFPALPHTGAELKILPNPVVDIARVMIYSTTGSKGTLLVLNAAGQQVMQETIIPKGNMYLHELNMRTLAKGNYTLVFVQEGSVNQSIQIVKL